MSQQLDLNWKPEKHARRRDPMTSMLAAERMKERAPKHATIILESLKRRAGTFSMIAADTGLTDAQVWRRLSDLEDANLAHPTGIVIDGRRVWRANES